MRATLRLLFLLPGLVACATVPTATSETPRAPAGAPALPARIIDAHMHFDDETVAPSEKMLGEMRGTNVVGAVVHATRKAPAPNVRKDTGVRIALCAAVVPPRPPREVEQGLRSGKYSCMKIYLAYVPRWATDRYYQPFYRLAEKYKVPVVFHTGDPVDKDAPVKYADPITIDEIAIAHRGVNFVLAHLGNPWIQSAAEVVYKNDNVYADVSALMIGELSKSTTEALEELVVKPVRWFRLYVENPKKLLFGTDWPLTDIRPYAEAIARAIPPAEWEDVFYNNAVRVFPSLGR